MYARVSLICVHVLCLCRKSSQQHEHSCNPDLTVNCRNGGCAPKWLPFQWQKEHQPAVHQLPELNCKHMSDNCVIEGMKSQICI